MGGYEGEEGQQLCAASSTNLLTSMLWRGLLTSVLVVVAGTTRDLCRRQVTGKGRDGVARLPVPGKERESAEFGRWMPWMAANKILHRQLHELWSLC